MWRASDPELFPVLLQHLSYGLLSTRSPALVGSRSEVPSLLVGGAVLLELGPAEVEIHHGIHAAHGVGAEVAIILEPIL